MRSFTKPHPYYFTERHIEQQVSRGKNMKKTRNWSEYNESLVNRGSITFWFCDDVLALWTYRSAEGFGRNVFSLLGVRDASIPDYTSLCKRSKTLNVSVKVAGKHGPLDVIVDSTGLKVYGEGEWKVRKHGRSKHRTWRKLHIAMDAKTQQIVVAELTPNGRDDASVVPELLAQIDDKIGSLYGDGAYDKRRVYKATSQYGICPVIPPRKNARLDFVGSWGSNGHYRNDAIAMARSEGLDSWKEQVHYHRRSLGETVMFRIKRLFGERLKNRNMANQRVEAMMKINALNKFTLQK